MTGTTTTTNAVTTSSSYNPCPTNIAIIIDDSIKQEQMSQVTTFISKQLIASWTHFERLEVGEYGDQSQYTMYPFDTFSSSDEVAMTLASFFVQSSAPSVAG
jgi:hypothetical protein